MMPGWSVQVLRDRERDLRAQAERRRENARSEPVRRSGVLDLRDLARTVRRDEDPCPERVLERAG